MQNAKKGVLRQLILLLLVADGFVPAEEFFLVVAELFEPFGEDGIEGGFGFEFFYPDIPFAIDRLFVFGRERGF